VSDKSVQAYYDQRRAAAEPRRSSPTKFFVAAIIFILIGAAIVFTRKNIGIELVPEAELKVVEGTPRVIGVKSQTARRNVIESLTYAVGDAQGYISQYHPKYDDVYAAVRRGRRLKVWIDGRGDVYKIKDRHRTILSYDDTAKERGNTEHAGLVVGIALSICGLVMAGVGCFQ
jgi:hypothetical protein